MKNIETGDFEMGDTGKKDKGKKEQKKKPKLTIKEKRKLKHEKHSNTSIAFVTNKSGNPEPTD